MGAAQAGNAGPEGAVMIAGVPEWSARIRQLYWQLRYVRKYQAAPLRKAYRRVRAERNRLEDSGLDAELVRLFCRWMADPRNEAADARWRSYAASLEAAAGIASRALKEAQASSGGMGAERPIKTSAANCTVQRIACAAAGAANDDIAPYRQGGS
jgi:hypothetical protein